MKSFFSTSIDVRSSTLEFFDPKNKSDIERLNLILDDEIKRSDVRNESMSLTHEKMVNWLKIYVNSKEFMDVYKDNRTLELMAEATFWTVKLGLESHLAKMTYEDIRQFRPLDEIVFTESETAGLIKNVYDKLVKPASSYEASFALGQAAWCVYVHNNSYKKLEEEKELYESKHETKSKI